MYENYAFGDASLRDDAPPVCPADGRPRPRVALLEWLREGQQRLTATVRALDDDAGLGRQRLTDRGEQKPTRWIVRTTIAHDLYYAGEINHVRALLQANDRWPYEG